MNMLVAMESPISAVASSAAGTNSAWRPPQASAMSCWRFEPGSCQSGFFTNAAVGEVVALTTARVRPASILSSASTLAVTTRSQPITRRASPVPRRATCTSPAVAAIFTCDITAPYFCARPDMSSTDTPLPSRCAATPRIWPMVMTPVPPMPVTSTPQGCSSEAGVASGSAGKSSPAARLALLQLAALHRDEARAEPLHAGKILVARGLVDGALPAVLGLQRLDRQAVRLRAAIPAALAHHLVDHRALGGIGEGPALATPAFLRGAGLVVDQRGHAGQLAQLALHGIQVVAVADGDARCPVGARRVFLRLVGDDDDRLDALGGDLTRDHRRVERPVVVLAAGHRHRVVVEDLVGHGDLGGHRGADREQPRMEVGAVAEVGEDVLLFGEGRLPDPGRAFGAHVGEGGGIAVHPHRHEVAADAGGGAAALGHARGGVVRAAGAEIGLADRGDARPGRSEE